MSQVLQMLDEVGENLTSVYNELRDKPPTNVDKDWWTDKLGTVKKSLFREEYDKTYKTLDFMLEMAGKTHPKMKVVKSLMDEIEK